MAYFQSQESIKAGAAPSANNSLLVENPDLNPTLTAGRVNVGNVLPSLPQSVNSSSLSQSSPMTPIQPAQTPVPSVPTVPTTPAISETPSEVQQSDLIKQIQGLNLDMTGKSADQAAAENAQGLPALQGTVKDLTARATALSNEALALPMQLQQNAEGRGITSGGLAPIQTAALRNNAIQALSVNSLLATAQGNVSYAQSLADRAVAAKYDPIEAKLTALTKNLELIKNDPQTSIEDKNRAAQQQNAIATQQAQIDKNKTDAKTIAGWAADALKNGAPANIGQQIMDISNSDNPDLNSAFSLYSQYATNPAETAKALQDVATSRAQEAYYNAQSAKIFNDIKASGSSQAVQDQRTSAINLVNTLLNDKNLKFATGLGSFGLPGTPAALTSNNIQQLKGILALSNRSQLKGSGAISDFESKTLDRAASSFGTNLSAADAQHELRQIRGVLVTMNGGTALIHVTNDKGESQDVQADSGQISKMVNDGLQVEYQ